MWLNDQELLAEVRTHSRAGAEALYDQYSKPLLLSILRRIPEPESANDILCETYKIAWETIHLYPCAEMTILAWMMKIARNRTLILTETNIPSKNKVMDVRN